MVVDITKGRKAMITGIKGKHKGNKFEAFVHGVQIGDVGRAYVCFTVGKNGLGPLDVQALDYHVEVEFIEPIS